MIRAHTGWLPIGPNTNDEPDRREVEELADPVAQHLERPLADAGLQHDQRKQELQPEAPGDRAQRGWPCGWLRANRRSGR